VLKGGEYGSGGFALETVCPFEWIAGNW